MENASENILKFYNIASLKKVVNRTRVALQPPALFCRWRLTSISANLLNLLSRATIRFSKSVRVGENERGVDASHPAAGMSPRFRLRSSWDDSFARLAPES